MQLTMSDVKNHIEPNDSVVSAQGVYTQQLNQILFLEVSQTVDHANSFGAAPRPAHFWNEV